MTTLLFVSALKHGTWGAAEELWTQTAQRAAAERLQVVAVIRPVVGHESAAAALVAAGVEVLVSQRGLAEPSVRKRQLVDHSSLVIVNQPNNQAGLSDMEMCSRAGVPYVVVTHWSAGHHWPNNETWHRLRTVTAAAKVAFFVSPMTQRMTECQLGIILSRAEVVRSPFKVPYDTSMPWPPADEIRLACVARLDPEDKGQDILFHLLAKDHWRERRVALSLFGSGNYGDSLRGLVDHLSLENVRFAGFAQSLVEVWRSHHVLVMPSRAEGCPVSMIEAMLCARPCLVTDIGGMAEFVVDGETGWVASAPTVTALDAAAERMWRDRGRLPDIGWAGALRVRSLVPADPVGEFLQRLLELCG